MRNKYLLFCFTILTIFHIPVEGQEEDREAVLQSITSAANYASNVLIDDEGKSRCDYNLTEGKWYPYEEPWHTGQVIYGLLEAYEVTHKKEYLLSAIKAGNWWANLEIKEPGKLQGMLNAVHGDDAGDVIVFATVTDGTPGIFKLSKITGDDKYAEVATRAGAWMLEYMCDLDKGLCFDAIDPQTREVIRENSPFHQGKENQTLYDVARPNNEGFLFLDMYRFSGNKKYQSAFLALCNSLVEKQDAFGLWMQFMPNHAAETTFHPRFNLWYAESLLEGYDETKNPAYLTAAKATVDRYLIAQQDDGAIYYKNYLHGEPDRGSICGSAVAFTGLLMIRLNEIGLADYTDRINLCAKWLINNQYHSDHPDKNLAGAYLNTRVRNRKGKKWIVNRDVGTAFGLRFLSQYYKWKF